MRKYISLFPGTDETQVQAEDETSRQREEIKSWVRNEMKKGTLNAEPEQEILERTETTDLNSDIFSHKRGEEPMHVVSPARTGIEDDNFFEADLEESSGESSDN